MRVARLIDEISFEQEGKEYNPAKVLIDSDNSNVESDGIYEERLSIQLSAEISIVAIYQFIKNLDIINKICTVYIGSKSTQVVRQNKNITPTINKLEEVHTNLWDSHDLLSESGSIYVIISMCDHTCKMWTLY